MHISCHTIVIWCVLIPDSSPSEAGPSHRSSEEEEKAIKELVSDLPEDEEDYLDLTLQEEAQYLEEYLAKVNSVLSTNT